MYRNLTAMTEMNGIARGLDGLSERVTRSHYRIVDSNNNPCNEKQGVRMVQVKCFVTTMIVALIVAGSLQAQECTGGKCAVSVLPAIASKIRLMSATPGFPYRVYLDGDFLFLIDREDGREVASLQQPSQERVLIRSIFIVGIEDSDHLRQWISDYNDRADVGTLSRESDGVLVLVHNLNPREVDIPGMTQVALLMASAARHETRRFASVVGAMSHSMRVEP